jgi:large subunit ribosomal protein L25
MAKQKATEKLTLAAEKREVLGKHVKQLRKQGSVPANIYGPDITSMSITVNGKELTSAYKTARETGIVYISLDKETVPTLIKNMQRHPVSHDILHVDFRKIDLKQKIETTVPIEVVGESTAVNQLGGVLLTQNDHLLVEALPEDIPQTIQVDISAITELGQDIKVSDLKVSGGFVIKNEPETVIVSVIAHKEESVTPETTAEAPEVIGEAEAAAEGEEGEAGAEKPAAEKPAEENKKED